MIKLSPIRNILVRSFVVLVCYCGAATVLIAEAGDTASSASSIRTLYLVRHGAYHRTSDADDFTGNALIPLGVAQARLAGSRLQSLPVKFDALYSSTMTRARQTARVIVEDFPGLSLQQTPLLAECTPATWRQDIMRTLDEGEAESCEKQLDEAFVEFFKPAVGRPAHDILVFHGNAIRYLVTRVLKVETNAWLGMGIGHTSITVVRVEPDGALKLRSYSDIGHLAPNMQTGYGDEERKLVIPGVGDP